MVAHMGERQLWLAEGMDSPNKPEGYVVDARPVNDATTANLIASMTDDGRHLPTLDVDYPVRAVETSPGKSHVFIDTPMSWENYLKLLDVMQEVGILEPGWVQASKREGATVVRLRPEEKRRNK